MREPVRQVDGFAKGSVLATLRLEGLAALAGSIYAYHAVHGRWLWFAVLFLVPDLTFLSYLLNPRVGSVAYDTAHSYLLPATVLGIGLLFLPLLVPFALIWVAHIAFDRSVGYGLKYASSFDHTHLGPIGPAKRL